MEEDFSIVCSKIDEEKEYLNWISQEIWKVPELLFKEFHAHAVLTAALEKYGFQVERKYLLETAFRTEYSSKKGGGPAVAILLEYDALPEIGHACGHNLIAEAGLAAAVAVKEVMDRDPELCGKLVVMGTPAEEGGGGKVVLLKKKAFEGIDAALMVHPTPANASIAPFLCVKKMTVTYVGIESHAAAYPWLGKNALDAAVACYNNLSLLRQQILPSSRIHAIIKEGGTAVNVIPARSRLELSIRTQNKTQLQELHAKVESCIQSAASATGCKVNVDYQEFDHLNVISNRTLAGLYRTYAEKLGMKFVDRRFQDIAGSTDMGNVSHKVPSIHPFFKITDRAHNHTKGFTEASGVPEAQPPTLIAAKSMAMVAISVMRNGDVLERIQKEFREDISECN